MQNSDLAYNIIILQIAGGTVPLYTVDIESFRDMLHAFDPRFELPYRQYFTKVAIPTHYTAVRDQISREMQQAHWLVVIAD